MLDWSSLTKQYMEIDKGIGIILGITVATIIALIGIANMVTSGASQAPPLAEFWQNTSIRCLPIERVDLAQDIRSQIAITVNGAAEEIPANIGLAENCLAEIHTLDTNGEILVRSLDAERVFTIADFFTVWGSELAREGYEFSAQVNDEEVIDPRNVVLEPDQQIVIAYTGDGPAGATTTEEVTVTSDDIEINSVDLSEGGTLELQPIPSE